MIETISEFSLNVLAGLVVCWIWLHRKRTIAALKQLRQRPHLSPGRSAAGVLVLTGGVFCFGSIILSIQELLPFPLTLPFIVIGTIFVGIGDVIDVVLSKEESWQKAYEEGVTAGRREQDQSNPQKARKRVNEEREK